MIATMWQWLSDPANWTGAGGIGARFGEHIRYSLIVLLIAAAIGIPAGLWAGHTGRGRVVIAIANAARAIPTIGLLFAIALWIGPHIRGELAFTLPSILVLVLLALPPILAGAYAGIDAISPAVRDAARGMGLTPGEVLRQVEVPLALPLLVSGLRSAVLQVVATATIAAYVGLGGLGRYLIDGLASGQYAVVAGGAVLVGVLALIADLVMAALQRAATGPGVRPPKKARARGKQPRPAAVDHVEPELSLADR